MPYAMAWMSGWFAALAAWQAGRGQYGWVEFDVAAAIIYVVLAHWGHRAEARRRRPS